jgi:hypothetical protein
LSGFGGFGCLGCFSSLWSLGGVLSMRRRTSSSLILGAFGMTHYSSLYEVTFKDGALEECRKMILYGDSDAHAMFVHVGNFNWNFGTAEFSITLLLWVFAGRQDMGNFELLVKGMDARVKVERLRKAIKLNGSSLGPNFKERLSHFEQTHINIRNKLAHHYMSFENDTLHFGTVAALPHVRGYDLGKPAETIAALDLFERAYWLNRFNQDLRAIIDRVPHSPTVPKVVEIENPKSWVPKASPARPPQ